MVKKLKNYCFVFLSYFVWFFLSDATEINCRDLEKTLTHEWIYRKHRHHVKNSASLSTGFGRVWSTNFSVDQIDWRSPVMEVDRKSLSNSNAVFCSFTWIKSSRDTRIKVVILCFYTMIHIHTNIFAINWKLNSYSCISKHESAWFWQDIGAFPSQVCMNITRFF